MQSRSRFFVSALAIALLFLLIPVACYLGVTRGWRDIEHALRYDATLEALHNMSATGVFRQLPAMFRLPQLEQSTSRVEEIIAHPGYPASLRDEALRRNTGSRDAALKRALWQQHRQSPEEKYHYADYCLSLYPGSSTRRFFRLPSTPYQQVTLLPRDVVQSSDTLSLSLPLTGDGYEEQIREGMRIDPTNALYHYLLADYLLSQGVISEYLFGSDVHANYVIDQRKMEAGIAALKVAWSKPELRQYAPELFYPLIAALPAPTRLDQSFDRIFMQNPLKGYSPLYRPLMHRTAAAATILYAQGRQSEARELMQGWRGFAGHISGNAEQLNMYFIGITLSRSMVDYATRFYLANGEKTEATRLQEEFQRFVSIADPATPHASVASQQARDKYWQRHAPLVSTLLLPDAINKRITQPALALMAPMRRTEQSLLELLGLGVMLLLYVLAVGWLLLQAALAWLTTPTRVRRAAERPRLLLRAGDLLPVLGYALLLPLALYWGYANLPALSGRSAGFLHPGSLLRMQGEVMLLIVVLFILPWAVLARRWRERGLAAGLEISARSEFSWPALAVFFSVLWLGLFSVNYDVEWNGAARLLVPALSAIGQSVFIAGGIILALRLPTYWRYSAYYCSMALSLAPVYALLVLLLALLLQPALLQSHQHALLQDRLFSFQQTPVKVFALTPLEEQRLLELREEVRRYFQR